MFTSSAVALALLSVTVRYVVATPPACLLAAVNTCPDPSDLKAVCNNAANVESYLSSKCGNNVQSAMADFKSVCSSAGVTIPTIAASSSASASSTGTAATSSIDSSGPITSGASGASSATGTGSPSTFATGLSGSGGILTAPAPGQSNGTASTTAGVAGPSASGGSGTGSSASPSGSSASFSGGAARLGMDVVGLVAVGAFGVMLAM